jgi:Primase C terminal 2 (PriCT-2)
MPCSPYKGTHIGHGEWSDIVAAVWCASGGSDEGYQLADDWSKKWFYYDADILRKRWSTYAQYPPPNVDAQTLFKLAEKKAEREQVLNEVAQLADLDYEEQRTKLAKARGVRVGALDEERKRRRKSGSAYTPPPAPKPTIEQLAESAKDIIACPDVLDLFAKSIAHMLAGEERSAQLLYLCATSRLFAKPMNVVIRGLSAIGKSHLRDRVFDYIPPEDIVHFTALSEKALLYLPDSLAHKILSMAEAVGAKEHDLQDYLIREIISAGRITYLVPVRGEPGELATTQKKVIEGPIQFVTSTTRARLHNEVETRVVGMETDDTEAQTRRVVQKVAEIEGGLVEGAGDLAEWLDFQRWLALGERQVVVPYVRTLASQGCTHAARLPTGGVRDSSPRVASSRPSPSGRQRTDCSDHR